MSPHLDNIINKQHGASNIMVVYIDIVKYSLRKSVMQQKVINAFNGALQESCDYIAREFATDAQKRNLNFANDIIRIPTGDGAAIAFPFEGFHTMHLHFAVQFLRSTVAARGNNDCTIFDTQGWCNCHDFFDVRIGISEGRGIIFKDINGNYNVAGNPINLASRVMGLADNQQLIVTETAYKNIIDMTEDTELEGKFKLHGPMPLKHDVTIDVCQYIGAGENFISTSVPKKIEINKMRRELQQQRPTVFKDIGPTSLDKQLEHMKSLEVLKDVPAGGLPVFMDDDLGSAEMRERLQMMVKIFSLFIPKGAAALPRTLKLEENSEAPQTKSR
jgi:class 3 adenylate cyclase